MKSNTCLFLLSTAILLFFTNCKKDEAMLEAQLSNGDKTYANVPELLWDYFQRFEEAALDRGIEIDLASQNISAEFMEISEDGVAGSCSYGTHNPGHIVMDLTFWKNASDLFKEMIVFHELGHCSLKLGHREGVNSDGTCVSIMRSGLEACRDNYLLSTREAYLDELFGSSVK